MKFSKIASAFSILSLCINLFTVSITSAHEIKSDEGARVAAPSQAKAEVKEEEDAQEDDLDEYDDSAKARIEESDHIDDHLKDVLKRFKNISTDLNTIVEARTNIARDVEDARAKIESRRGIVRVILGTSWKNIGELRSEYAKNDAVIKQLTALKEKVVDPKVQADIQEQIDGIVSAQAEINSFIETQANKFSLFGWVGRLLKWDR